MIVKIHVASDKEYPRIPGLYGTRFCKTDQIHTLGLFNIGPVNSYTLATHVQWHYQA